METAIDRVVLLCLSLLFFATPLQASTPESGRNHTVEPSGPTVIPVVLRLAGPSNGEWEVISPSGERACRLPCEIRVDQPRGWYVRRLVQASEESSEKIPFPDDAVFAPGTVLRGHVRPKRGSVLGASVLALTSLGVVAIGAGLIATGGCKGYDGPSDPALCFTSLALVPVGLAGTLAGVVWLALSHQPRVDLVRDAGATTGSPPKFQFAFNGNTGTAALRF
jgi:hypothetical protein